MQFPGVVLDVPDVVDATIKMHSCDRCGIIDVMQLPSELIRGDGEKKLPGLGESEKGQEFPLHSSLQFSFRIPIVK